ncbi:MAG: hypothetical protein ACKO45_05290 [Cyanobium sp.]
MARVSRATSPQDLGQRLNVVLDQAAGQITREQGAIPAQNPWRLVPEILRTSVVCLALAKRKDAGVSFLADLLWPLERLRSRFRLPRANRNGAVVSPEPLMRRLAEAADE